MKYVIKSKNRLIKIEKKTLSLLRNYGVEDEDINIFVSDDKDLEDYKEKFNKCNIIKGDKGIVGIDNFIVNYFDEGEEYIYMNDDVSALFCLDENNKKKELDKSEFKYLVSKMFSELKLYGGSYCGIYPCNNNLFMSKCDEMTCDLCICMDPFSAIINNKEVQLTEFIVPKEDGTEFVGECSDAEKTLQHFKSKGGIVRLNHYCMNVEYYTKQGGYQGRQKN